MARSGGARGTWCPATSTASATCTGAATVQESLWKSPHPPLLAVVVVVLVVLAAAAVEGSSKPTSTLVASPYLVGPILIFQGLPLPLISFISVKGNIFFLPMNAFSLH